MKRTPRMAILALCLVLAAGAVMPLVRGDQASPAEEKMKALVLELGKANAELGEILPSAMFLGDAKFRQEKGADVLPKLKRMISTLSEIEKAAADADAKEDARIKRNLYLAFAAALGDKDSVELLQSETKVPGDEGLNATSRLMMSRWLASSSSATDQIAILNTMTPIVKANPKSDDLAGALSFMTKVGSANKEVTKQVIEVIRDNVKTEDGKETVQEYESEQAIAAMNGKPFIAEGRTIQGGHFTSASLKGKVVLFDFWATWCGPCVAALPDIEGLYKKYHDQGLEIVGVNCDATDDVVKKFIQENKMPWVQLREVSQNEEESMHPIAKKIGVSGIPTVVLIDRDGVVRFTKLGTDGQPDENLDGTISKLLSGTANADAPLKADSMSKP